MLTLVAATRNPDKMREIKEILAGFPFRIVSAGEVGITELAEENGATYEENALLKARKVYEKTGGIVLADDSGLEVNYLGGSPGIMTSRFAGEKTSDFEKNIKLLQLLNGVPFEKRQARFVCAIAVILPDNSSFTVRGCCEGYINSEQVGKNGFGYDPIFYIPEYGMTTAQLDPAIKHEISHRGKALRLARAEIERYLSNVKTTIADC